MSLVPSKRKTAFVIVLSLLAVVSIVIMTLLQYRAVNNYRQLGEIRVLISDMQSDILTLRRNEKDFLARKDVRYQKTFVDNFERLQTNVATLKSGLQDSGIERAKVDQLDGVLETYSRRFLQMVELQRAIGLHHEDGLYGRLRRAIHQVEDTLQMLRQDRLLKDMLMLRRHEKDFMLRRDSKYVKKFDQDMAAMRADLSGAYLDQAARRAIHTALNAYERDFKELVSATREMGLTSDDALHGEMRSSIHQGERLLSELRQDIVVKEGAAGSSMINQIIAFAVVLTLLIAALIRL